MVVLFLLVRRAGATSLANRGNRRFLVKMVMCVTTTLTNDDVDDGISDGDNDDNDYDKSDE